MPAPDPLRDLVEGTVAESVDAAVAKAVGSAIPRAENGRYRVTQVGSFSRRGVSNLITIAANPEFEGAIVFFDGDVVRSLYAHGGRLVGADSNVLFERLGRVLEKSGKIDRETRRALVAREEAQGTAAAAPLVPPETARFGLELRVREVAETLFLVKRGQFVVVEGAPALAPVPEVSLAPEEVAAEGIARYEAWRAADKATPPAPASVEQPPPLPPVPPPAPPPPPPPPAPPRAPAARATETQEVTLEAIDMPPVSTPKPVGRIPGTPRPRPGETQEVTLEAIDLPSPRPAKAPAGPGPGETQELTLESLDLSVPRPRGSTTTTADLKPVRTDEPEKG